MIADYITKIGRGVWSKIFSMLHFREKVIFRSVCRYMRTFAITSLDFSIYKYATDLAPFGQLTEIHLSDQHRIKKISHLTSLTSLNLSYNKKICKLPNTQHLTSLDLSYNEGITKINAPFLKTLILAGNNKIIALPKLKYLETLNLHWNEKIHQLSRTHLPNLTDLNISCCKTITNINHFGPTATTSGLSKLTLNGENASITDISALASNVHGIGLCELSLAMNSNVRDVSYFSQSLISLNLSHNKVITDISALKLLETLILDSNSVISHVPAFANLTSLSLNYNSTIIDINHLGPRATGCGLRILSLNDNTGVRDISGLASNQYGCGLIDLSLQYNETIHDISALGTSLIRLNIKGRTSAINTSALSCLKYLYTDKRTVTSEQII